VRLTAFDRLHLQTGLRWSRYDYTLEQISLCIRPERCPGKQVGDVTGGYLGTYSGNNFSWPPPISLSFDITKQLTAYFGYTDIYQSQAAQLTKDRKPVDPITGGNYEAGLKWAARDGRLNVSLSAYQIRQNGFATPDRSTPFVQIDDNHSCCYVGDPNNTLKSQGFDLEVTGEVVPGWQVSASYTFSENERTGVAYGTSEGKPFLSNQPKNLYKLWTSYDFGAAGSSSVLSGLTVSGGFNGQTSGYYEGSSCRPEFVIRDAFDRPGCAAGGTVDFSFTAPGYVVLSGRLDYRLSDKWSFAVNLENILDKTYYSSVGDGVYGGNWYGTPRSVTFSVRSKW
jgi:outer membrane receptor for ferric coprogen and ferric-rhodotorulic acid